MPRPPQRRWALIRLLFGLAQMFGATFSFVLLFKSGVNIWSLTAVALTGLFTTASVLLFGRRTPPRSKR